jgi:hypothetical protein
MDVYRQVVHSLSFGAGPVERVKSIFSDLHLQMGTNSAIT